MELCVFGVLVCRVGWSWLCLLCPDRSAASPLRVAPCFPPCLPPSISAPPLPPHRFGTTALTRRQTRCCGASPWGRTTSLRSGSTPLLCCGSCCVVVLLLIMINTSVESLARSGCSSSGGASISAQRSAQRRTATTSNPDPLSILPRTFEVVVALGAVVPVMVPSHSSAKTPLEGIAKKRGEMIGACADLKTCYVV